jgi:hypothetical protein
MNLIRSLIIKIFVKYFAQFSWTIPKILSIDYDGLRGMSTENTSITSFGVVTYSQVIHHHITGKFPVSCFRAGYQNGSYLSLVMRRSISYPLLQILSA